jgi:hypothetical protein
VQHSCLASRCNVHMCHPCRALMYTNNVQNPLAALWRIGMCHPCATSRRSTPLCHPWGALTHVTHVRHPGIMSMCATQLDAFTCIHVCHPCARSNVVCHPCVAAMLSISMCQRVCSCQVYHPYGLCGMHVFHPCVCMWHACIPSVRASHVQHPGNLPSCGSHLSSFVIHVCNVFGGAHGVKAMSTTASPNSKSVKALVEGPYF